MGIMQNEQSSSHPEHSSLEYLVPLSILSLASSVLAVLAHYAALPCD